MQTPHISVLLDEVINGFKDFNDGVFIDCTLGFGGHSEAMLKTYKNLNLIGCDKDENALNFSKKRLNPFNDRVRFYQGGFRDVIKNFKNENIKGVLADIGVSSWQLDEKSRGFGFDSDKLDMRMNMSQSLSAYEVVNSYTKEDLEEILREYGEISLAKKIANDICEARKKSPIKTPRELLQIIGNKKQNNRKVSIATLVFQAIRIEVNDELGELNDLLKSLENLKPKGTKLAIITFHSLEDRIVKKTFKLWEKKCICSPEAYRCECGNNHNIGKIITKKPIKPSDKEIKINPRARSAKLRIFEFEK